MQGKYLLPIVGVAMFCSPVFSQDLPRIVNPSAVTNPAKLLIALLLILPPPLITRA